MSDDGHLMAYQTDGTLYTAAVLKVMNLQSGDEYTIEAADGQAVRPLGFVNSDFIYGKINPADAGITASGEETTPMYELEIRNSDNEVVTSYSFVDSGMYTTDILIEDNLVTLTEWLRTGMYIMLPCRNLSRIMRSGMTVRSRLKPTPQTGCRHRCALRSERGWKMTSLLC